MRRRRSRSARSTAGLITAFGSIDPTDGGDTSRYSVGGDWQRGTGTTLNKIQAYGIWYDLTLVNNFTFYLDDPVHGDQNEQQDHRFVAGCRAFQKRQARWGTSRSAEHIWRAVAQRRRDERGALPHGGGRASLYSNRIRR